ncbi:MAG: hypothetical protein HQ518_11220 [Rhodopirellula sp.]|nr:hypothetical protein [Rhodopirellula sp.]
MPKPNEHEGCVDRIPDVAFIRNELARNLRERELLSKLLKVAERKAAFSRLESVGDNCPSRQDGA